MEPQNNEQDADGASYESYFRDPSLALDAPLSWAIGRRLGILDALRGLLSGSAPVALLRVWCFMELASLPQSPRRTGR